MALGYSKQVSLSIEQPLVQCLIKTHLVKENDNEHIAVRKFKEIVARELKQRFPLSATDPPPGAMPPPWIEGTRHWILFLKHTALLRGKA